MWDAELLRRVRDRKLNEIMVFASMAKIDSANVDSYIDIVVSLGDDVDACDTLLDTEGEAVIELDPIDSPRYTERLSDSERSDEDAFNALKSPAAVEPDRDGLEEVVRGLISDAVDALMSERSADALETLKTELEGCRARIDVLSGELEYARTDAATTGEELAELRSRFDVLREANDTLTAQRNDLRNVNDELSSEVSSYRVRIVQADERASALESERRSLTDECASLRETNATLTAQRNDLLKANDELRSKVSSYRVRMELAEERASALESERRSLTDECASLRKTNESLTAQRNDLLKAGDDLKSYRVRTEQAEERVSALETERQGLDEECSALRETNATLTAQRNDLLKANDELRSKVSSYRVRMELAEQKIAVLEPAYQKLADECSALRDSTIDSIEEQPAEGSVAEDAAEPIVAEPEPGPVIGSSDIGASALSAEVPLAEHVSEPAVEESVVEVPTVPILRESIPEPVEDQIEETTGQPAEGSVAEDVAEPVEEAGTGQIPHGSYLSRESIDVITRVRAMKDSKIDEWISACDTGDVPIDVCDGIVHFLKTDVAICDAILAIDFRDRSSVVAGFRTIVDVARRSSDPDVESQKVYVESLTEEEASLEYSFSRVINSLQGMMMYMKDEISS